MLPMRNKLQRPIRLNLENLYRRERNAATDFIRRRNNLNHVPQAGCANIADVHIHTRTSRLPQIPARNSQTRDKVNDGG